MVAIADDFNRADAASLGASWTDYSAGSALRIVSNTCQQTTASTSGASRHNTAMAVPHWSRATLSLGSGDCLASIAVRCDTGAITFYYAGLDRTAGVLTSVIFQVTAGTPAVLSQTALAGAATGRVCTLYATGTTTTTLTLVIDGVQTNQVADATSAFSTQTRAGLLLSGAIATADDFAAQDVATAPIAPTGLGATSGDTQVVLAWTAPFNGMASISDYVIEYSTDNTNWSTFSDGTSTAVTATVTGLTNNTPYWFRVSATNSTGTGAVSATAFAIPAPQVALVGVGAFDVDTVTSNAVDAAYPAGYTAIANDVAVAAYQGLHNNTTSLAPTVPTNYTQIDTRFQNIATYDLQITAAIRKLTASEAAPTVTTPAAYSTSAGGLSAYLSVWRGVDTTTAQDATAVVSSGAAAATFTPTGIAVVTEGAAVISAVASADDNALGLSVAQGFTLIAGVGLGASDYDTTTGGDHSMGMAWRVGALQVLQTQAAAPAQLTAVDNTVGTAYNYRWTGAGVTIFVIGGGIRGTHNEFTSRLGTGYAVAAASGADPFTDNTLVNVTPSFPNGHDTAVASVALGTTYGTAKGATIYPIVTLTSAESTANDLSKAIPAARLIDALDHIASVAVPGEAVVVFSNIGIASGETDFLGGTYTSQNVTDITAAFQDLCDLGIPCVIAAGNQASSTYIAAHTPMNMADVITVGNTDAVTGDKSTTSNFGTGIHIWAPGSGTGTQSAAATSNSATTGAFNGTSEAAPNVAGVIACLLQGHPSYTDVTAIKAILLSNATATGSVGAGSPTKLVNSLYMPDGAVGTSIMPTWSETINGNDAWAAISVALRPQLVTSVALVVADLTAANTLDNVALTQHNVLAVADLTGASVLDNVVLTQHNVLVVADLTAANALDAVTLTEHAVLAVAGLTAASVLDAVTLTQHNILAVDDMVGASVLDNVDLTQHGVLAVDDMTVASSLDAVTLGIGGVTLVVADMTVAASLDNVALTQHHTLIVADLTSASTLTAVVLTQHHALAVDGLTGASTLENVTLGVAGVLGVAELSVASSIDEVTLTQHHTLVFADLAVASTVGNVNLGQNTALVLADMTVVSTIDATTLTQHHTLTVANLTVANTIDDVALTQHLTLVVADLAVAVGLDLILFAHLIITGPRVTSLGNSDRITTGSGLNRATRGNTTDRITEDALP